MPEDSKRKAPGLFLQAGGLMHVDMDYSHSMVAGGLDVMS